MPFVASNFLSAIAVSKAELENSDPELEKALS